MAGWDDIAIATVHCIVFIVNIVGNSLVCAIIKRNKDMRYVNINYEYYNSTFRKAMFSIIILHTEFKSPKKSIKSLVLDEGMAKLML